MKNTLKVARQQVKVAKIHLKQLYNIGSLPDFYIIGAAKSGTSSLYTALTQHPGIINRVEKEIHFFDYPEKRHQGISYYKAHFLPKFKKQYLAKKLGYYPLEGDATPFMLHFWIPKWLSEINPDAKLIAILRDPISRAISGYYHNCKMGRENLSFEEAIASEHNRVNHDLEKLKNNPEADCYYYNTYSYLGRGHYYEQLISWLNYFSQEQMFIVSFEDFIQNQQKICSQIFDFLEIPNYQLILNNNKTNIGNYVTKIDEKLKLKLQYYFKPHNQKLFQLLQKEFDWSN